MFHVELICTDESCAQVTETTVFSQAALDVLTCDSCGCTLQWLAISELDERRSASTVQLPLAA